MDTVLEENIQKCIKTYINQLTPKEMTAHEEGLKDYAYAHEHKPEWVVSLYIYQPEPVNVLKAFMLTESNRIPLFSLMQEQAFENLEGEAFNLYLQRFTQRLNDPYQDISKKDRCVASIMRTLTANKDFRWEHIEPFLSDPDVKRETKGTAMNHAINGVQNKQQKFLTKNQLTFIINLASEEKFFLPKITSSIKHAYNLQHLPDHWVEEIFGVDNEYWRDEELFPSLEDKDENDWH